MHKESLKHMKINIKKYLNSPCKVLDVGSMNVKEKGSYRQLLTDEYDYIGVDLTLGKNVDIVLEDPYVFPFLDDTFDVIMSGQCFEHCKNPFKLITECARVLKPGGVFLGVAPSRWYIHKHPVDCWRILPDGWEALFDHAGLITVETYLNFIESGSLGETEDCWGIAKK